MFLTMRFLRKQPLDLSNQSGQVWLGEAHLRSRNPIVFYIRRDVLVVRMVVLETRLIGMRLRIVPVQLLVSPPDLVSIALDQDGQAIKDKPLKDDKADILGEKDLARESVLSGRM
jgi:hypothetical protein